MFQNYLQVKSLMFVPTSKIKTKITTIKIPGNFTHTKRTIHKNTKDPSSLYCNNFFFFQRIHFKRAKTTQYFVICNKKNFPFSSFYNPRQYETTAHKKNETKPFFHSSIFISFFGSKALKKEKQKKCLFEKH